MPGRVLLRRRVAAVEGAAAVDEELHAGLAIRTAEARVVGRTLVTELRHGRQCLVVGKVLVIAEHGTQHAAGGWVLDAAVVLAVEVGSGEVHAAIGGVGTGADCGGVGHPHARGRAAGHQQWHGLPGGALDHFGVAAAEAQAAQCGHVRALLRRQHALLEAHVGQCFHLRQALARGFARVGPLLAVALRSHVAVGQAAIVVGRPHQAIKIHFVGFHRLGSVTCCYRVMPGVRVAGKARLAVSSEATG